MDHRNDIEPFSSIDIDDYDVPPLPKVEDNRGYIYIVVDTAFPNHFKMGRTICMKKRLMQYNSDKPFPTTKLYAISRMFTDANMVEKKILEKMYEVTPATTFSREWFALNHLGICVDLVKEAETHFSS